MSRIFISYRRVDSQHITGRIYDRLCDAFGKKRIFKDVDNIPPGRDFRGVIRKAAAECRVMLVVIGPNWLDATDVNGDHCLEDPNDLLRTEVETGLQRNDIVVIPLLVAGAQMPRPDQLPDALRALSFKEAYTIHDDTLFHSDMDRLIPQIPVPIRPKWWFPPWLAGIVAFLLIALGLMVIQLQSERQIPTFTPAETLTVKPTISNTQIAALNSPPPSATSQPTCKLTGFPGRISQGNTSAAIRSSPLSTAAVVRMIDRTAEITICASVVQPGEIYYWYVVDVNDNGTDVHGYIISGRLEYIVSPENPNATPPQWTLTPTLRS